MLQVARAGPLQNHCRSWFGALCTSGFGCSPGHGATLSHVL